jgi:hypothetical protein
VIQATPSATTRSSRIMLAKGRCTVPTRPLRPKSRILVLKESCHGYLAGSLLVPNGELGHRTRGNTTHEVFVSLLDLNRAVSSMAMKSGMFVGSSWGEFQLLDHKTFTYGLMIASLSGSGILAPELQRLVEREVTDIVHDLRDVRNELKLLARPQLRRGARMTDRRGRRNPGAARAAGRAGIEKLDRRKIEIARIMSWMGTRGLDILSAIEEIRVVYAQLWERLKPRPSGNIRSRTNDWQDRFDALLWPTRVDGRAQLRMSLVEFHKRLVAVDVLPFSRNAQRCAGDVKDALKALDQNDENGVRKALQRLRRGVRWMSVLLQVERLLAQTSALIVWRTLTRHARRQRVPGALSPSAESAELDRRFEPVRVALGGLSRFVNASSVEGLAVPEVKEQVLSHVTAAQEFGVTLVHKVHASLKEAADIL